MTSLVDALKNQQPVEAVRPLITPDATKEKDSDGNFPLHWAAAKKASVEVVKLLLDAHPGAAKEKNSDGHFPLHLAAANSESVEVVQLLFDAHPGAGLTRTVLKALMCNPPLLCTHLRVATAHLNDPNDEVRVAARNAVDTLVHPADRSSFSPPLPPFLPPPPAAASTPSPRGPPPSTGAPPSSASRTPNAPTPLRTRRSSCKAQPTPL